jgi:hypothetical protein
MGLDLWIEFDLIESRILEQSSFDLPIDSSSCVIDWILSARRLVQRRPRARCCIAADLFASISPFFPRAPTPAPVGPYNASTRKVPAATECDAASRCSLLIELGSRAMLLTFKTAPASTGVLAAMSISQNISPFASRYRGPTAVGRRKPPTDRPTAWTKTTVCCR